MAVSRFAEGFHCSQSVLATYAGAGLSETAALRMAAALAGGSTVGGECGAVAAGYLVLGLRHGGTVPVFGDVESERELFDRIRGFVAEFKKRHGAITCRDLLGVDVFTPQGLAEGRRRGLFRERCPRYIRDAITILESLDGPPGPGAAPPSEDRR
jgi:C_GCAxxG_C_C family probable redox protein